MNKKRIIYIGILVTCIVIYFIFLGLMIYFIYKDIRSNKKLTINSIYMILSILALF